MSLKVASPREKNTSIGLVANNIVPHTREKGTMWRRTTISMGDHRHSGTNGIVPIGRLSHLKEKEPLG